MPGTGPGRGDGARRGLRTALIVGGTVGAGWLLSACTPTTTFTVTTIVDGVDAAPGDGVCEMTAGAGDCSLRAAVMEANALGEWVEILLAADTTYPLTLAGAGDDAAATGDLDVDTRLTVRAASATATVSGGGLDRVFDVHAGRTLELRSVHVTRGDAPTGAGVRVGTNAKLIADGSEIHDNAATSGAGGIDASATGADLQLNATTVADNSGGSAGGIAVADGIAATQVTVSSNTATAGPGGIALGATAEGVIGAATVTANTGSGAGGVGAAPGVHLLASVVAGNAGGDCTAALASDGYNADGDTSCLDGSGTGDQPGVDPRLGPLSDNGGPTRTHLPFGDSPLLDTTPSGATGCDPAATVDQRGTARPVGPGCDTGAVELVGLHFEVDDHRDLVDAAPGDGLCVTAEGVCTLRAALTETDAAAGPDTVTLAADPAVADPVPAFGNEGLPFNSHGELTLEGAGHTIDANGWPGALSTSGGGTLTVRNAVVTGATYPSFAPNKIAIQVSDLGDLVLDGVTVTGNAYGGLVVGGDAVVRRSAFIDNGGYAISTSSLGTSLTVSDTTFSGNEHALVHHGTVTLSRVTVFHPGDAGQPSTDPADAPIQNRAGFLYLDATIVDSPYAPACSNRNLVISHGHNVISDSTCRTMRADDLRDTSALLEPLTSAGGRTPHHPLSTDSPARDSVPVATPACDGTRRDQHGTSRPQGAGCDRGAVES